MALLEKLTIKDTFKQWRDKINALIDSQEGVISTNSEGNFIISPETTATNNVLIKVPTVFEDTVSFQNNVNIGGILNATSTAALKLKNSVLINGTEFDGSVAVVTDKWGAERSITITDSNGNIGEATLVDGSEDIVLKLPTTISGGGSGGSSTLAKHNIDGVSFDGTTDITHFGVCDSASGSTTKIVTGPTGFSLVAGASILVKFTNSNTSSSALKLQVNDTTATSINFNGSAIPKTAIQAGSILHFVYDGTSFNLVSTYDKDENVKQDKSTTNADYPLLCSKTTNTNTTTATTTTVYSTGITLNPSNNALSVTGDVTSQKQLLIKNTNDDINIFPSSKTNKRYLLYQDKNNKTFSTHEVTRNTDGSLYSKIVVPHHTNGTEDKWAVFQVGWNATNEITASVNGDFEAERVYNAVWNDYAEFFPKGEETEAGDIIALDVNSKTERYIKATNQSKLVVGVHSNTFGHIIGGEGSIEESKKTNIPIGLAGRVYVKFVGKSVLGEAVVPSEIPGVGRLYDEFTNSKEQIVGYIVEDSSNGLEERMVKILIKTH